MSHATFSTKMILGNNRHLVGKVSSASGVSEAPHPVAARRAGQSVLPDFLLLLLGFRSDLEREKFISSSCTTEGTQKTVQLLHWPCTTQHNTTCSLPCHVAYNSTDGHLVSFCSYSGGHRYSQSPKICFNRLSRYGRWVVWLLPHTVGKLTATIMTPSE